jgi:phosphoribosyl 1,2-cyclic phosphodiesterase
MRARIWGCRGSVASPGPDTVRYGGNTSCVEVRLADDTVLVLDAGTGMRPLGLRLADEGVKVVHVLLSHLHLDHLQGLAFFAPLYEADVELHIWGPPSPMHSLEERIAGYMSEPLFPVNLSDIPCTAKFHDATESGWELGTAAAVACAVSHQGPTLGYRLEENGRSLVYIPDHEPSLGKDLRRTEVAWVSGYGLAAGADILLHDAQYTEAEYRQHVGWGHSSVEHVVTFAVKSGVKQLLLFHHDPRHTDEQLDALLARATELWNGNSATPPLLAREGMEIEV